MALFSHTYGISRANTRGNFFNFKIFNFTKKFFDILNTIDAKKWIFFFHASTLSLDLPRYKNLYSS